MNKQTKNSAIDRVRVAGRSVQGPRHQEDGTPCQDSWDGEAISDSEFVLAVGDGLGSSNHSDVGSQIATETVVSHLKKNISLKNQQDPKALHSDMQAAFRTTHRTLHEHANKKGYDPKELNTTLLAVVSGPAGAAGAAVGDGGIVGHYQDKHSLLVPKEKEKAANVTTPLVSSNWKKSFRFGYEKQIEAVAVFSDGLSQFVWDLDDNHKPRDEFFDRIFSYIKAQEEWSETDQTLHQFLTDDLFEKHSGDDKTLALGFLPIFAKSDNKKKREQESFTEESTLEESLDKQQPDQRSIGGLPARIKDGRKYAQLVIQRLQRKMKRQTSTDDGKSN